MLEALWYLWPGGPLLYPRPPGFHPTPKRYSLSLQLFQSLVLTPSLSSLKQWVQMGKRLFDVDAQKWLCQSCPVMHVQFSTSKISASEIMQIYYMIHTRITTQDLWGHFEDVFEFRSSNNLLSWRWSCTACLAELYDIEKKKKAKG